MHSQSLFIAEILAYILAARVVLQYLRDGWRELLFTLLNLGGLYLFFFHEDDGRCLPTYLAYLGLVLTCYAALRLFVRRPGALPWLAFFTPILFLILIRYVPASVYGGPHRPYGPFFLGISYLAVRNSYMAIEIRNGSVTTPGLLRYLGYCFFVPTMSVGPINPYGKYLGGFGAAFASPPAGRAALRLLVGLVKYKFLGSLLFQVTYATFLLDDHYHPWVDLPIAMVFYYLFLYCNFSGFCDMAIGAAGLIGIPVAENFDNPFAARNVKDFWNRWHITLSTYMRDVVFAPLSKCLVRSFGPAYANHAIALTILIVFLLVGIWHGVGWNYFIYGALHALGVVTNHYYTIGLKKWLGREGFKAYNENRWIRAVAVTLTFGYCAGSLMFFANTLPGIKHIFSILR